MKKNIFKTILFTFSAALALISCKEEDNDFTGRDNHIISFGLTVSGVTYKAAISDDQIIMSVPEGLSLRGAAVDIKISENAKISPDPAAITEWDQEELFVVTSYNNARKSYIYRLERSAVSTSGNVILTSQAEVDAFAATGISIIDGNLTIGKAVGTVAADSIQNLSGLSALRQVSHNITVNNTYSGEDLAGLANLEKTGGLKIGTVAYLTDINFPNLTSIGTNLSIASVTLREMKMPELAFVGENLTVKSDSLISMDLGELSSVAGDMTVNGSNASAQKNAMEIISFPKLSSVGGAMTISYWPAAVKIELPVLENVGGLMTLSYFTKIDAITLPALKTTGGLTLSNSAALAELNLPVLEKVGGNMSFATLASMETFEMDALAEVEGGITLNMSAATWVQFPELSRIGGTLSIPAGASKLAVPFFPKLKEITGDLDIRSAAITDFTGFEALEEIGARLYLYNATGITSLTNLGALKKVGTSLYLYGLTACTDVDIRGIETPLVYVAGSTWTGLTLTADDTFEGTLSLNAPPSGLASMPSINGFETVGGLIVSTSSYNGNVEIGGIGQVTGLVDFTSSNNCPTITMPDLEKAGGIKFSYNNSLTKIDFPKLEEITGESTDVGFSYPVSSNISTINLPKLKKVDGNFSLTGLRANYSALHGMNMPLIEQITGTLTITGTSNTGFTDLNNFNNVTSAGKVVISNLLNLTDYTGLRNAIPSLNADTWKITGCGYNPTYQNMADGQYVRP